MQATATRISFLDRLERGDVLIADGATGTTCQHMGLPLGVAPEEWVLTDPDRIIALHRGFAEAGSDIVLTCTFGGTSLRLAEGPASGRASELNRRAAELAREAVGPDVLVAGSLGPDGPAVRAARHALARRGGRRLRRAGRGARRGRRRPARARDDVLPDRGRARRSTACAAATDLPFVLTFSFDRGTRTMMGTTTAEVVALAAESGAAAVGANCGTSLEAMSAIVAELSAAAPGPAAVGQAERRPAAHDGRLVGLRRDARAARRGRARLRRGRSARRRRLLRLDARPRAGDRRGDQAGLVSSASAKTASAASPKSTKRTRSISRSSFSAARVDGDRDLRRELDRIAVDAGRDRGKRDRATAQGGRDLERAPVARGEQRGLPALAAAPDRADRVDDMACRAAGPPSSPSHRPSSSRRAPGTRPGSPGRRHGGSRHRRRRRRAASRWRR